MSSPDHSTQGEDLNLESKSTSRRSSIEDDSNKNSEAKCNHCDQIVKIKYFRQHYIKHIYKELEQFIMREKGVDKKSSKCTMCNGKKGEKVWEMKALVKHIALVHDLLSHFLRENGQELHEHFRFVSKSRNPSGESSEHQPDTFIAALSNKSKEIALKNKSEIEDKNIEPDSDDSSLLCYTNNLGRQKRDGTDVDQLETQSVLSGNLKKKLYLQMNCKIRTKCTLKIISYLITENCGAFLSGMAIRQNKSADSDSVFCGFLGSGYGFRIPQ